MDKNERNAQSDYMEQSPPCLHCKNIISVGGNIQFNGWTCRAFPEGIPPVILKNRINHKSVIDLYPGQKPGFFFEGKEKDGKTFNYEGNLI
jgi:hypothetical protein